MRYAVRGNTSYCKPHATYLAPHTSYFTSHTTRLIPHASLFSELQTPYYISHASLYRIPQTAAACVMRYAVCGLGFSIRHQVCGTRSEVPVCVTVRGLWYSVCGIRYAVWGMRFGLWGVGYEACGMRYALWGMWYELQVCGTRFEVWGLWLSMRYEVSGLRYEVV